VNIGPGYRVYYAQSGHRVVLLLLIVLRQMAQAFGGVQAVAEQAHLNPTQLYCTLSPKGNPALSSLSAILKAMGLRLAVQPLASA
jgi:DNA-binding phage protein